MPRVLEVFATYQPMSFMIDAVRGLVLGDAFAAKALERDVSWYVGGSLLWALGLTAVFAVLACAAIERRSATTLSAMRVAICPTCP